MHAKKSFENTLKEAPEAKTILLASCITPEANERIIRDSTIKFFYNLTEVIREKAAYRDFTQFVFSLLAPDHD